MLASASQECTPSPHARIGSSHGSSGTHSMVSKSRVWLPGHLMAVIDGNIDENTFFYGYLNESVESRKIIYSMELISVNKPCRKRYPNFMENH